MQRIVDMLVLGSPEPRPLSELSPWIDARFRGPVEAVVAGMEAQAHRRLIKSHLPLDALPLYKEVRYIHVARDGRDACLSWHNHSLALAPAVLGALDRIGLEDERIGRPYPRPDPDFRSFYRSWLVGGPGPAPGLDFFEFEASYWAERVRPNLLLVHYADLKADLAGEVRRIAAFLGICRPPDLLGRIVEAAGFEAMRRDGEKILPTAGETFRGGADRFLFSGTDGRWRGALGPDDLALYDAKVEASFTPACARWVEGGRRLAGDPPPGR
jgi:aryl sulfotransferase